MEIINRAKDGARTTDLHHQLDAAPRKDFDVILIQPCGNDILRFTGRKAQREATANLLDEATQFADLVVMMSTGDVGTAPAFPKPLDWLYSWRTRQVRKLFLELALNKVIEYMDLYDTGPHNPFRDNPTRHYTLDGLYPSGVGYRVWFEQLLTDSSIERFLTGASSRFINTRVCP